MVDTIQDMLHREPFRPFRVVLTSGDRYTVTDPALAVLMRSQLFLAEPRSDRFHLLRLNQIAALESQDNAA